MELPTDLFTILIEREEFLLEEIKKLLLKTLDLYKEDQYYLTSLQIYIIEHLNERWKDAYLSSDRKGLTQLANEILNQFHEAYSKGPMYSRRDMTYDFAWANYIGFLVSFCLPYALYFFISDIDLLELGVFSFLQNPETLPISTAWSVIIWLDNFFIPLTNMETLFIPHIECELREINLLAHTPETPLTDNTKVL